MAMTSSAPPLTETIGNVVHDLAAHGCALIQTLIDDATCDAMLSASSVLLQDSGRRRPGARRVLQRCPDLAPLIAASPVASLMAAIGGPDARVVRSIIFEKSAETNWLVPWHQDPTIAVAERRDAPGFDLWNVKDGEVHCRPPTTVLDAIFIIRVHLDDCTESSGPLRVIRGSHRLGILTDDQIQHLVTTTDHLNCTTPRGGAALMRPLSVHSSAKATSAVSHRRVLHLECSAAPLPAGLRWAECD
jgi:hypothetical protein